MDSEKHISNTQNLSTVLQELEEFTYATALDLNWTWAIILSDWTQICLFKICTIIFPWGSIPTYNYQIGNTCSPDIFQAKMSELMVALEFISAYIDDLLCITKCSLNDHLSMLRQVFIRLRFTGLKVNAAKCSFCATETEYLGYVLTREGIKPQPKKVEAILALTPPQNVKQLCRFLGVTPHQPSWRVWIYQSCMGYYDKA